MKKGLKILLILSAVFVMSGISLIVAGAFGGVNFEDAYLSVGDYSAIIDPTHTSQTVTDVAPLQGTDSSADSSFMVDSGEGIVSLDIDWVSGSVDFVIHEDDHFGFSEHSDRPIEDAYKMVVGQKGNTLEVDYTDKVPLLGSIPTKYLTVYIPAAKAAAMNEIRISVTSAEVSVSGITADKLIVSSVSGEVYAEEMTLRYVSIETTSGEVMLNQLGTSCTAEMNTVSGDIDLSGNYQEVEANSTSGEVKISLSAPSQELEIDTTSGDVTLQIPDGMGLELEYDTVSGDFISDMAMVYRDESYILNGGGAEYEVSTTSGDLIVQAYIEK